MKNRSRPIRPLLIVAASLAGCGDEAGPAGAPHHVETVHDEGGPRHVELSTEQLRAAGIGIAQAGPVVLDEILPLHGTVVPNAERVLDVTARFPGIVRSARKRVGDAVRRGDTLATVESNESLQTYALTAPIDGVVTRRDANEGAPTGDETLFTVADLSTVWVEVSIFPRDLAKVRVGQTVRVHSADTGSTTQGRLVYVAPFGTTANQTLTARVQLPNDERKWPPGLFVNADVVLSNAAVPLGVRSEALQRLDGHDVVFVRGARGFEARTIEIGRADGEHTEVRAGISAGETYATSNSFIIKAELGKGEAGHDH